MKVRKLVLSALGWCYKLVVAILALFAAAYVQDHAPEWELPLAGIGVLLAAIGGLAWQRAPTRMRWLPIGVVWIGIFAAIFFAIFHGWIGVVQAIIGIIGVVFLIVSTILFRRAFRATFLVPPELALEASQPITPSLGDDSDAVKVYPSKGRLVLLVLVGLILLVVFGGLTLYTSQYLQYLQSVGDWFQFALGPVLTVVFALATLINLRQLIRPQPLFTLSSDGIRIRGMTLVRWREIVGIYIQGPGSAGSWLRRRVLRLDVANPAALIRRQSRRVRAFMRLSMIALLSPVVIAEQQLPMPLEQLEEMMVAYLKRAHGDERDDNSDQGQD